MSTGSPSFPPPKGPDQYQDLVTEDYFKEKSDLLALNPSAKVKDLMEKLSRDMKENPSHATKPRAILRMVERLNSDGNYERPL